MQNHPIFVPAKPVSLRNWRLPRSRYRCRIHSMPLRAASSSQPPDAIDHFVMAITSAKPRRCFAHDARSSPANTKGRLVMTAMITFALGDASVTALETRAPDARWRLRDPRPEFFVVSVPPEPQICTQCGTRMQEVATVAPFADQPGLRAYQCSKCGHTSSVLEAPDKFRARSPAR